jgi:hypothetical protein
MTKFISHQELERLTEAELRSKLFHLAQELYRVEQENLERTLILASLEQVHRALTRKKFKGPRP